MKLLDSFRRSSFIIVFIALGLVPLFCSAQDAALARHRNLADMSDEANVIVQGRVMSVKVEPHPEYSSLTTVVVQLQVEDSLKGSPQKIMTFRQYLWDVRARYNSGGYRKGEEMLLFLRPPSRLGLTSPAGLEQGRFEITRPANGRAVAINGHQNVGLFEGLPKSARAKRVVLPAASQRLGGQATGPVDLEDLKQTIRALAGTQK
jgi:hypothetical protein